MGSVVAYSYESKTGELAVRPDDLIEYGAVSQPVVEQMAIGVQADGVQVDLTADRNTSRRKLTQKQPTAIWQTSPVPLPSTSD